MLDTIRHYGVFDQRRVRAAVVAGVGAVGGMVALQLAKLGIESLSLYDPDRVESHNVCNQVLYGPEHVGEFKVHAAHRTIDLLTGLQCVTHAEKLGRRDQLRGGDATHVFACVDSMRERRKIFDECVWMNPRIEFYCDLRMDSRNGTLIAFDPREIPKSRRYCDELYPDEDVPPDTGACGNVLSIGATAGMLACRAIWRLISHYEPGARPYEEFSFSVSAASASYAGFLGDRS